MKRIIILAVTLSVALSACNALDLDPKDRQTQKDYFKNETDLQLFTNPFYNNILNKSPYNEQSDLIVNQTLSEFILGGNKRTVPPSGGGWTWTDLRRMNELILYADNCPDKDVVTHYVSLTQFFRAYFYFEKVKRFGDVPWYDKPLGSADKELQNPRDSREFIMHNMLSDIDSAIKYLPPGKSAYRVNKWAALALKARFCLFEGTFRKYHNINLEAEMEGKGKSYEFYLQEAAKAAKTLIDEGPYKLYTTGAPDIDYLTLFSQENASADEYILAIKFDNGLGVRHNATAYTLVPTQGRPGYTKKMINMYLMKDGTAFTNRTDGWQTMSFVNEMKDRDPRLMQSVRGPGYKRIGGKVVLSPDFGSSVTGYQPIKFVQDSTLYGGDINRNERSTCDLPVFRFAEVLLNYAEAKAELGQLTQDDLKVSVNLIRKRAGMPDLSVNAPIDRYLSDPETGFTNVTGGQAGVILEIRRERAIELMQEGFRIADLLRWKAGNCIDQKIRGMYFDGPGEYDLTGDGVADVILYAQNTAKPPAGAGVQVYEIGSSEGGLILDGGNRGYTFYHKEAGQTKFNQERDYLYPIPIGERSLNRNLKQNPGWNDGLNF